MNVYLDIETIPTQREDLKNHVVHGVEAPANYKDPAKIKSYIEDRQEEAWRKTSLSGLFGEVVCIGWAVDDKDVVELHRTPEEPEDKLLRAWYHSVGAGPYPTWIGHNVFWDLRFLWHRSVVNRVQPLVDLACDSKPWDGRVVDTMMMWAGLRDTVSLNNLCKALGIPTKGDLDGSKVWEYVTAGRIEEVAEYCKEDVERARAIHKRLTFAAPNGEIPW